MIDRSIFARVMRVFADRFGRALEPETQAMYFATLGEELDTGTFQSAAVLVFKTHGYNTWPAPGAFLDAAKIVRHERDAEIKVTQKLLTAYDAQPTPREQAVDEFAEMWRRELADCDPALRRRASLTGEPKPDPWLTNERRATWFPDETPERQQDADADRDVA